jgi:hypothetical protein
VFDVSAEGAVVINDLDVYAQAGTHSALVKEVSVTITDGTLNLLFAPVVGDPILSAIELIPA